MTPGGALPVVAVVGRPNVGKSSLVNRILGRREAIVEETPGVTRDRQGFSAEWGGRRFEVVDTGGLEPGVRGLDALVAEQAEVAIESADVVLVVVDAVAGVSQDDLVVAEKLRRSDKPIVVVANKVDDARDEPGAAAFYRLGLGDPVPVSALHGRGSGDLLEEIVRRLPEEKAEDGLGEWGAAALIGRPNVGKSSLLNALTKQTRALVHEAPGTTRDPVDSLVRIPDDRVLRLVDTAGLRREVQIKDAIEYFGWLRSRRVLQRVDAVFLIVDVAEGVTGHDQRIAEEVVSHGRACVVVLNKWDLVDTDHAELKRLETEVRERLRFVRWAGMVRTSALSGRGVDRLLPALTRAIESHRTRIPTATLNRLLQDAQQRRPHARTRGRAVRVLYGVQADVSPPRFILFPTGRLAPDYLRFLENQLRTVEPFEGSPLLFETRVRSRAKAEVET